MNTLSNPLQFNVLMSDEPHTSAVMTLSPMTKFSAALSYLKSRLLFENKDSVYSATLPDSHAVPANQILRICTKARDGERPLQEWRRACGRPPNTWIHQICRVTHTGVTATEALQLVEDRPFWRTIAMAGGFGWTLRVMMMTIEKDEKDQLITNTAGRVLIFILRNRLRDNKPETCMWLEKLPSTVHLPLLTTLTRLLC